MLMPVVRQGPAPDGDRNGGNQPAHQSRSTDVQRARLLPCTTLLLLTTNAQRGAEHSALPLENGHQSVLAGLGRRPRAPAPRWRLASPGSPPRGSGPPSAHRGAQARARGPGSRSPELASCAAGGSRRCASCQRPRPARRTWPGRSARAPRAGRALDPPRRYCRSAPLRPALFVADSRRHPLHCGIDRRPWRLSVYLRMASVIRADGSTGPLSDSASLDLALPSSPWRAQNGRSGCPTKPKPNVCWSPFDTPQWPFLVRPSRDVIAPIMDVQWTRVAISKAAAVGEL